MTRSSTMRAAHFAQYLRVSSLTTGLSAITARLSCRLPYRAIGLFAGKDVAAREPDHPNGKCRDRDDREQVRVIRAVVAKAEQRTPDHDDRGQDAAEPVENVPQPCQHLPFRHIVGP